MERDTTSWTSVRWSNVAVPDATAAYGLILPDLPQAAGLLREPREGDVPWRIHRSLLAGAPSPEQDELTDSHAVHPLGDGGFARIDRATSTTELRTPFPLSDGEVVHPHLASTAVVSALWRGLPALHGGAVCLDGRVFVLLGDRGAGKSTAVWSLLEQGGLHVTDDIVIVEDGRVLPGPRCVDLRRSAAGRLGVGESLGVLGRRERWRVGVSDDLPDDLPLAGFVELDWSPDAAVGIDELSLPERFGLVTRSLAARVPRHAPRALIALATLPALRWRRPRDLDVLDEVAAGLVSALRRVG